MGSVIHECIEAHHEVGRYDHIVADFRIEYNKLFNEEKAELGDLPTDVERIMARYVSFYANDGLQYVVRKRGRKTELPVNFWMDPYTQFLGYLDAYPVDKQKRNWLMDHKVPKRMPDEDSRYSDIQFAIYVWAAPQARLPEPDGIIWDYVKRNPPKIPEVLKDGSISKRKIDSDYIAYMAMVRSRSLDPKDYEEFAQNLPGGSKFLGLDPFFQRVPLPNPSRILVRNIVDDFKTSVEEIRAQHSIERAATDRNITRNCKQCEYFSICSAETRGLDTEFLRKSEYITKGDQRGKVTEEDDD
jgi:hypothetical protein